MRFRVFALWMGAVVVLAAGYGYQAWKNQTHNNALTSPKVQASPEKQATRQENTELTRPFFPLQRLYPESFLILGLDSRTGEPARSDTIMLAVLDPESRTANIIPIPRDTYVKVPGHVYTKINHAMTYGGPQLMKRTVEEWLKINIDHTVVLDFDGFRRLVDLLGGLHINVEKNMNYDDPSDGTHIHLRAGEQLLNGKQALDYSRFRYDPEADTGRMRRQQQVIRVMIDKGMSVDTLPKIFRIVDILGDHLKTSMTPGELLLLAKSCYGFDLGELHTESIKGINQVAPKDGLWYFFVEKDERERIQQLLANWLHSKSTSRAKAP